MYREKSRSKQESATNNWWYKDEYGKVTSSGTRTSNWTSLDETIKYNTGTNRSDYRPCSHVKFHHQFTNPGMVVLYAGPRVNRSGLTTSYPMSITAVLSAIGSTSFPDVNAFCQRALDAMTPSMNVGVQGVNFILELPEILTLKATFSSLIKSLRNPTWKSLADSFSDGNLAYAFGIKPLISDLMKLKEGLTSFEKRLSNLQRNVGKPMLRHYTETATVPPHTNETLAPNGLYKSSVRTLSIVDTATMRFTYSLPEMTQIQTKVRGLLDTLGLQLNAGVIWEAIPFSFVVDWFFNVDDVLAQFSSNYIEPILRIGSFGVSRKVETGLSYMNKVTGFNPLDGPYTNWTYCGDITYSSYSRKVVELSPDWFTPELLGRLNARKVFLGSLLFYQKALR